MQKKETNQMPIVAIGASAGGLEAFKRFFHAMPSDSGICFVLIPHLDPSHKSLLVDILSKHTSMEVVEVSQQLTIQQNHLYVFPPNHNLKLEGNQLIPHKLPKVRGVNMPIDLFFESLAKNQREKAIGVILSGTMTDGSQGVKIIKEYGGLVMAQSPETAEHDGMIRSAISTGMVDIGRPIEEMPQAILNYLKHPYVNGGPQASTNIPQSSDELNKILAIIGAHTKYDFRCYKETTLIRRIERRMGLKLIENMENYAKILEGDPDEVEALYKDLLIGVTGFFREESLWDMVSTEILPNQIKQEQHDKPFRVWVPGCSTGEEPYTIAMILVEAFEALGITPNLQIFATDIDEDALNIARNGVYPENIAASISEKRLRRFFIKEDQKYMINKDLRELVVFAVQNLISDAPFSNMDLISCRNLLIYLQPEIQNKIIRLFNFSLKKNGYLILGSSETIAQNQDLFETISKDMRVFKNIGPRLIESLDIPISGYIKQAKREILPSIQRKKTIKEISEQALINTYVPASVIFNRKLEIVYVNGPVDKYLNYPQGYPELELLSVIKEEIRFKLRAALQNTIKKTNAPL